MTKSSRVSHQGMKSFSVSVCERVLMRAVPIVAMIITDEDKMSTHYTLLTRSQLRTRGIHW